MGSYFYFHQRKYFRPLIFEEMGLKYEFHQRIFIRLLSSDKKSLIKIIS